MRIIENKIKDIPILMIEGQIDIHNTAPLRERLDKYLKAGCHKVVIDFEKVTYVDSSGLAVLIEMFQRFKRNQGGIAFVNMTEKVHNLFEITKIDMLLSVYDSQKDALDSL